MRRARVLLLLIATGAALASTEPAQAGQLVFERGAASVWAMNEDGSGSRKLVDLSQLPGMQEIDSASVQPDGTEVAFVAGWAGAVAEEARWDPLALGYCGVGCLGYYELRDGTLQRMTEGPAPCPTAQPCRIDEEDARVAVDGSVAFSYQAGFGSQQFPGGPWQSSGAEYEPRLRPADGGAVTKVVSPCADPATILEAPAPNPTDPREVLYAGCVETSTALPALARSGPDPEDPGDDVGVIVDTGSFEGYDWQPDGSQIAFTDSGCSPLASACGPSGLQLADLEPGGAAVSVRFVLASPGGTTFYSPRFVGPDRIAFVAGGDIWVVPTSCRMSTCNFPADASRLTALGDVGPAIGYTTSTTPIRAVAPRDGGAGGGGAAAGNGGPSGGGASGGDGGRGSPRSAGEDSHSDAPPVPAGLQVKAAWIAHARLHVRASITRGADGDPVRIALRAAGRRTRISATVDHGRVRIDSRLPGSLRGARLALVSYSYGGSRRVLPARASLWAGPRPAHLKRRHLRLRGGRLSIAGTVAKPADGHVVVVLLWPGRGDSADSWQASAPIHDGRWHLARSLPAAARHGGELIVRYRGDRQARVRGEQLAGPLPARG